MYATLLELPCLMLSVLCQYYCILVADALLKSTKYDCGGVTMCWVVGLQRTQTTAIS